MASPTTATPLAADAATANQVLPLEEAWRAAQRTRNVISKEIEIIQKGGQGTNEPARFEKIEKLMQTYRLACIEILWINIRFGHEKKIDDNLWLAHCQITRTYRKVMGKLAEPKQAAIKKRLDKLYASYLKTAQYFYRGWMQRVCARYGDSVKDLKRIARMAEIEMQVPDEEKVDAATQQVDIIVRDLCHKTLIYLGDLARYRTLQRPKDRNWENALTYYSMADDLIPESGFGHHQSAVIYGETNEQLQVVYHFYRAMACDRPHPNAPANLAHQFQKLLKLKNWGTKRALVIWFVKLHAYYYQGKEFTERKELENEVDHHLAVAMKSGTHLDSDTDLIKIVLINITAYVVGLQKIQLQWTEEQERSCQYILLANLRTIHTICRLLKEEMTDLIQRIPVPSSDTTQPPEQQGDEGKFSAVFERILPLLRIYMAWLCSYNSELVKYQLYLEPTFGNMCSMLSSTLSLLFELVGSSSNLGTAVSWRFPEDELTLGIRCLNGNHLHSGCQLYYDAFKKKPKPRREEVPLAPESSNDVTFTRALDVALCAIDLAAPDSEFPFNTSKKVKGSQEHTTIVYLPGGKSKPAPKDQARQHSPHANPATEVKQQPKAQGIVATATPMPTSAPVCAPIPGPPTGSVPTPAHTPASAPEPAPVRVATPPSPAESNELSEDQEFYGPRLRKSSHVAHKAPSNTQLRAAAARAAQAAPASEFPIENHIYQILNDILIDDSDAALGQKAETPSRFAPQDETSYGMGSSTAQHVFGSSSTSPGPGSATAKAFPTLPWNYFYTPAPAGNSVVRNSGDGSGSGVRSGAWDSSISPRPDVAGSSAQNLQYQTTGSGSGDRAMWPEAGMSLAAQGRTFSNQFQGNNIWAPSANTWQTGQAAGPQTSASAAFPTNSPFSSLSFSQTSSVPPVNSPLGLPPRAQGFSNHQRVASQHSPVTANPLNIGYSSAYDSNTTNAPPGFGPVPMASPAAAIRRYASEQFTPTHTTDDYGRQVSVNAWLDPYARNSAGGGMESAQQNQSYMGSAENNNLSGLDGKQYPKR
ncbi:protein SMG7 [Podospora fimiseda]|uniref:Nonsense-mediated mRNA decay factor n=1 Tax=Podospora fimiseda TaxID=252190 RepID=A0AAN7GVK8_9PEZI|nr:protein SMG7 [Podospora fimiseda]